MTGEPTFEARLYRLSKIAITVLVASIVATLASLLRRSHRNM